jgi:hypothetical protein
MLDVHPPHAAVHTWKDFFIHIATIVVGLIIAVGLEQTVEYFHHQHQIHVARERILEEARVNQRIVREDEHGIERIEANLDRALILVRQSSPKSTGAKPATTETPDFTFDLRAFYDEAYRSARESGVLSLMPYEESAMYEDAYLANANSFKYGIELWSQMYSAKAAMHGKPLNQLDSDEILPLIAAISEARGKAELAQKNFEIQDEEWDAILKGNSRIPIK